MPPEEVSLQDARTSIVKAINTAASKLSVTASEALALAQALLTVSQIAAETEDVPKQARRSGGAG